MAVLLQAVVWFALVLLRDVRPGRVVLESLHLVFVSLSRKPCSPLPPGELFDEPSIKPVPMWQFFAKHSPAYFSFAGSHTASSRSLFPLVDVFF